MSQRGHVRRVGKTWRLELRQRRQADAPSKRVSVYLGTVDELQTRAAARRAGDRWLERTNPRKLHPGSVMPFDLLAERYIARHLAMHRISTQRTQTSVINRHLRPAFGCAVHEATAERMNDQVVLWRAAGVAPATIDARYRVWFRMIRVAESEGIAVAPLPPRAVVLPKPDKVRTSPREKAFTADEAHRILEAAPDPDGCAYALALYVGLRCGEVLGLQWNLVDLETGDVSIRQQAKDGRIAPPKSRDSTAMLRAPAPLLARLRAYRAAWQPNPAGLLFADDHGAPWRDGALRKRLHTLMERLGIPRRRRGMHAFRHCCAVQMANAGVSPEAMRRTMRHSSLNITAGYLATSAEDITASLQRGANQIRPRA